MIKRVSNIPPLVYELRPSQVFTGEVGAFAVRPIKKGEIVASAEAPEEVVFIKREDVDKLDPITKKKIEGFCLVDEEGEYCLPADLNNMGSSWYFNHSCEANIAYDDEGNFIADRDLVAGEELFLDYGRMFTDPGFRMTCACGHPNCRGVVSGNDWLDPEFRRLNEEKMWPEMRERLRLLDDEKEKKQ